MTRTDELRKISEAATQGPWDLVLSTPADGFECFYIYAGKTCVTAIDGPQSGQQKACATFIATFNPAFILDLLNTQDKMREALEEIRDDSFAKANSHGKTITHRDFARETLAVLTSAGEKL